MILPPCPIRPPPPILYVGCTTQALARRLSSRGHRGVAAVRSVGQGWACVGIAGRARGLRDLQRFEAHYSSLLAPRVDGENRPRGSSRLLPAEIPTWTWHPLEDILADRLEQRWPKQSGGYLYVLL